MSRPLQQRVRRVALLGVLLDGLQEQRVASDPLHRHHQEEAERGGVDLGPGGGGGGAERRASPSQIHCDRLMTTEINKDKRANYARRGLHHADDVVPQRLLLLVLVLQQRDVAVVGQVLPVGRLDVCRQAEEGVACSGRR